MVRQTTHTVPRIRTSLSCKMIGQVELTMQDCGDNKRVLEIGYLLKNGTGIKVMQRRPQLHVKIMCIQSSMPLGVYSIIRDNNIAS